MPFSIFLYIYWGLLAIFGIFNLLLLRHLFKLSYLGRGMKLAIFVYVIGLGAIIFVSHIFILRSDWSGVIF